MSPKYTIGIDLHGTLLDEQWEIKKEAKENLKVALGAVKDFCKIYICSGNDLTFVKKYISADIREYFDGYILETGCVVSDGKSEKIIIPKHLKKDIKNLEEKLKEPKLKEVKCFPRRLTTTTMFTKDERGGLGPDSIFPQVQRLVSDLGYGDKVLVTHSDVGVDVIPAGHNKFTGLKSVSYGLKTIGIADSLNDIHLMRGVDYAFVPANASPKLISLLKKEKKEVAPINKNVTKSDLVTFKILKSKYKQTKGVIDILKFINENLR